jgi:hypothetical protein
MRLASAAPLGRINAGGEAADGCCHNARHGSAGHEAAGCSMMLFQWRRGCSVNNSNWRTQSSALPRCGRLSPVPMIRAVAPAAAAIAVQDAAVASIASGAPVAGPALSMAWQQLVPLNGPWGVWAALVAAGMFGLWCVTCGKGMAPRLVAARDRACQLSGRLSAAAV